MENQEIIERVLKQSEKEEKAPKLTFNSVQVLLAVLTAIILTTLYIADRPSRTEVKEMINDKVEKRLENIEKQVEQIRNLLLDDRK